MKRRGFTLIELMVVIAIIIILAAIAIPNYLKMTERAKKSRIASDMATLATGLETFKTDWGPYPNVAAAEAVDKGATGVFYSEIAGLGSTTTTPAGTGVATVNIISATNAMGEAGQIEYLKAGTLTSVIDPFKDGTTAHSDGHIYYLDSADNGHWVLFAWINNTGKTAAGGGTFLVRTSDSSTVKEVVAATGAIAIADGTGAVTGS
jgi:prepilin-type N-terminal cleavage/methylation domain-containing protein